MYETEDAAWTGVPVESRAPLLDLRMLRFLLRVPPVPWCMEKELLREAMRGILPEEIRSRPKTPLLVRAHRLFCREAQMESASAPGTALGDSHLCRLAKAWRDFRNCHEFYPVGWSAPCFSELLA